MKSQFRLFILVAIISTFAACDNNANNDDETTETADGETTIARDYFMTALVDSVQWKANKVTSREEQGTIYITGIAADGSQVILELGEKPRIGIFPMRRGAVQAGTYVNQGGSKYYAPFAGTSGVINITEYVKDSILKGEFNFSASNTMDLYLVEDGSFSIALLPSAKPAL